MVDSSLSDIGTLDDLYGRLSERSYAPLWTMENALSREPATKMVPYLWSYKEARSFVMRAGELISVDEADRRVLAFRNPGTQDYELARATDMLWAAIQLVLPGELAPPHRHTPSALRFIIEGSGAYTVVNGIRACMEPGDFLITPNWSWHEHGHEGQGPMIWLDGLDSPMVSTLRLIFAEFDAPPVAPAAVASQGLRTGLIRPTWTQNDSDFPTLVWKLPDVEAALDQLSDLDASPYDDVVVTYSNPLTGGPALTTISAHMQLLRGHFEGEPHRHTSSTVYHVVRGNGHSIIAGQRFDWTDGDTFAVPTWATHSHFNPHADDALLFSFSDEPAVRALGLYRTDLTPSS